MENLKFIQEICKNITIAKCGNMEGKMDKKKQFKIIIMIIIILLVVTGILICLGQNSIRDAKESQALKTLKLFDRSDTAITFHFDEIKDLEHATFQTEIRSNGLKPQKVDYTGVELNTLFEAAGIDNSGIKKIIFYGVDGYVTSVDGSELSEKDNLYIAYKMNGKELKSQEEGGFGPYQLVIRNDAFSQRWCKYLARIEIQ